MPIKAMVVQDMFRKPVLAFYPSVEAKIDWCLSNQDWVLTHFGMNDDRTEIFFSFELGELLTQEDMDRFIKNYTEAGWTKIVFANTLKQSIVYLYCPYK